jgi:hypothetical protein
MQKSFSLASGTVAGADHVRAGRNNQDSRCIIHGKDFFVAVVCDGCSNMVIKTDNGEVAKPTRSEIGAALGSTLVAKLLADSVSIAGVPDWEGTRLKVIRAIADWLRPFYVEDHPPTQLVQDFFLFTTVVSVVTPKKATFAAIGDGFMVVNGVPIKMGPYPNNEPPYLAYGLMKPADETFTFQVLCEIPTEDLENFLIGSDGCNYLSESEEKEIPNRGEKVGSVSRLWKEDRFFDNPDMIRRHLTLVNGGIHSLGRGCLKDDITMIVCRKKEAQNV